MPGAKEPSWFCHMWAGWEWAASLARQGAEVSGHRRGRGIGQRRAATVDARVARSRRNPGASPLGKGLGAELLSRLRANHVLCLMSDRNLGVGRSRSRFLRRVGPSCLAVQRPWHYAPERRSCRVAVYHRGEQNHAICEPPIVVERHGKMREDIKRITQNIAQVMEMQIRREPQSVACFATELAERS